MGFILRVPIFTHFCGGFQCGNSSYEGHFTMCSLYALSFMTYFMGLKQQNRSGKSGWFKMIRTALWSPFEIWHHEVWYTYTKCSYTPSKSHPSRQCLAICHAKYHILKLKTTMSFQIAVNVLIIYYWNWKSYWRQIQVVDTKCFTVTETHGERFKDVKGKNEKRFKKTEGTTQTTVAEHQGKISHAHN